MSVAERLKRLGAWAERDVRDVILPFWTSDFIVDPENGGFYGRVTLDMKIDNTEPRGLTLTGRMLYAFSTAYRVFGDELYREKAAYTFRYLMDHFYDKEQGGAYITLSPQGEVLDDSKPSYCEAFLVLGCAAYGWAAGDQEALKVARETFEILESKMKFAPGCYYSNMSRDWKPVEGANLGNRKTPAFPKGSILYDPQLRNLKTIVDKEGARVGTHQSFGHDCEISYLILRVAELVGEEALTQRLRSQMTDVLRNVLENDFDPYHSLYNGCDLETGVRESSHVWWAQAEAVTAMLCGFELTGDQAFLTACERQADYIEKYFVNREHGDWYSNILVDEAGWHVVDGMHGFDKLNGGKCPFHNSQMCFEVMERTARLLKKEEQA